LDLKLSENEEKLLQLLGDVADKLSGSVKILGRGWLQNKILGEETEKTSSVIHISVVGMEPMDFVDYMKEFSTTFAYVYDSTLGIKKYPININDFNVEVVFEDSDG
jgi:hypothetical protein